MAEVPILWEESEEEFMCGLVFRVGRADERVVTGGITHLVEHLVLPTQWPPEVDFNATVSGSFTHFWFHGPKEPALEMLSGLARSLVDPPLERLGREKSILKAEASWRGTPGSYAHSAFLRFGAAGHGLPMLEEYGLRWLGRAHVRDWIRLGFGAANGVAYMTSAPPRGFKLELPQGRRLPPPKLEPIQGLALPAVYPHGRDGHVLLSLLGRRTFAARMFSEIAGRRIRGLLRYRLGISYSTDSVYEPLDGRTAQIHLSADTLDRDVTAARTGLVVVLDALAERGPTTGELERERETARREIAQHPYSVAARLSANACAKLDGSGGHSHDELLAGLGALTPRDVQRAAAAAAGSALLVIPENAALPKGRFAPYPLSSRHAVSGRRFGSEAEDDDEREWLTVGDEGVTRSRGGEFRTVTFAECAARIRFRTSVGLWSHDGFYVLVDPAAWKRGAAALKAIDAAPVAPENDVDLRNPGSEFEDPDLVGGDIAYDEERWKDAVDLLTRGLERVPDESNAWGYLAYARGELGQHLGAADAAIRAAELDPADDWAAQFASFSLGLARQHARAAELAAEALRRNPTSLHNMERAVGAFVADWLTDDAREIAARAVELFPDDDSAWFAEGWSAQAAGDLDRAIEALRRAAELAPENGMWHNNLAYALIKTGDCEEALRELERAGELDPDNMYTEANRLLGLQLLGRDEEARVLVERRNATWASYVRKRTKQQLESSAVATEVAWRAFTVDRPAGLVAAKRAVELRRDAGTLLLQAQLELGLDDVAAARRSVLAAADLSPDEVPVLLDRAWTALLVDDAGDARAAARRLGELRRGTPPAHLARAFAALASNRPAAALDAAAEARRIHPLDPGAWAAQGLALAALGRREEAAAALAAARLRSTNESLVARRLAALLAGPSGPPPA